MRKGHTGALQGTNVDGRLGGGMIYSHQKEETGLQQTLNTAERENGQTKKNQNLKTSEKKSGGRSQMTLISHYSETTQKKKF